MPTVFNKISTQFRLGTDSPITSGVEDWLYLFNDDDFTLTFDPTNPLIVTGITAVSTAKLFKYTGTNNSFSNTSKLVKTSVGPRYTEEIDFNIAGNSVAIKAAIQAAGYGRVRAIMVNNYKDSDSYIELFGAVNGLIISDSERAASDETLEGGYKIKLTQPDKLREPYAPRSINIAPTGEGDPPATYASTLAAIEALVLVVA